MAYQTILVVDDEPQIVELVQDYLKQAGFRVLTARDGQTALTVARHERPDLIVLDLMLPGGLDGLDVCRSVRQDAALGDVPIIMLTARDEEADRLIGLELGADDYVTKPFSPREVVARVRAVLRRAKGDVQQSGIIRIGDLVIDLAGRSVTVGGQPVSLTPTEFDLLAVMARSPGRPFTRAQLMDLVYEPLVLVLQTELGNGKLHEASIVRFKPVPFYQQVEQGHRVADTTLEILPGPMHYLFEMTHQGQHRQYSPD